MQCTSNDSLEGADTFWRLDDVLIADGRKLAVLLAGLLVTVFYLQLASPDRTQKPLVGCRSVFEPRWILGLRFTRNGQNMIRQGYSKFKNEIFKVQCNDTEIVVLPHKYVEELRSLPPGKLSSPQALYNKGLGAYTGLEIILESHLHFYALQQYLTPNLAAFMRCVKDELDYALQTDLPDATDEWAPIDVHATLSRMISRLSSRVFGGIELSRNEEWIQTTTAYPENAFACTMILRMVPSVFRPLLAAALPCYWRTRANIASAKGIVGNMVKKRRAAQSKDDEYHDERPNDLLQWMMDAATGSDARADKLAHRLLFLSDASVMTTSLLITHCLFDLCANPEYIEPIREEILAVLREGGSFQKTILHKMRKLDSSLKESQRLNPPFLMTFDRIVLDPLVLSDGTKLPIGTHLAMPTDAMLRDADFLPPAAGDRGSAGPDTFDPFRYSRAREDPDNAQRFQLATTEATSLPFGHGKHACPGRFFASSEAKLILSHLLLAYDFRYPEGRGRPENWLFSENVATDPSARLLVRRRKGVEREAAALAVND